MLKLWIWKIFGNDWCDVVFGLHGLCLGKVRKLSWRHYMFCLLSRNFCRWNWVSLVLTVHREHNFRSCSIKLLFLQS